MRQIRRGVNQTVICGGQAAPFPGPDNVIAAHTPIGLRYTR